MNEREKVIDEIADALREKAKGDPDEAHGLDLDGLLAHREQATRELLDSVELSARRGLERQLNERGAE